jgi:hypothetical protein
MLQRLHDWRHERYINRLAAKCSVASAAGDRIRTRVYWRLMVDAVKARSPQQIERMEARMDFNVRRTIKRRLMDAFLRGLLPASLVAFVFRLFRLRSL